MVLSQILLRRFGNKERIATGLAMQRSGINRALTDEGAHGCLGE
jgi:hypothetical protein